LEKLKESDKMVTVEGRETFDVRLEKEGWKIFEDWKSRQRVLFQAAQPRPANLEVKFLRNDLLVKGDEPFRVDFQVTNRTERDMWVKVKHSFAPRQIEKNIDMIVCGSLVPFRLDPRETREFSSAYMLRGSNATKPQISIIYEFSPAPASTAGQISAAAQ
jgi:cytochrome c oxidase assembly protein Cox11